MKSSPLIEQLMEAFRCLPGVGPRSAQRMALYLLERDRAGGRRLSETLATAVEQVGNCSRCHTLTEDDTCRICRDPKREQKLCCVVESPADMFAIEQSGTFRGTYFVLMGYLSPIDGIGPEQLRIARLVQRVQEESVEEVIIACNPTVEGEATAYYIAEQLASSGAAVTRIAHGVPVGGELEFTDGGTLVHAFSGRQPMQQES